MAASPNHLAFALQGGALEVWTATSPRRLDRLDLGSPHDRPVSLAFSAKGDKLAVGTSRGQISIFDLSGLAR